MHAGKCIRHDFFRMESLCKFWASDKSWLIRLMYLSSNPSHLLVFLYTTLFYPLPAEISSVLPPYLHRRAVPKLTYLNLVNGKLSLRVMTTQKLKLIFISRHTHTHTHLLQVNNLRYMLKRISQKPTYYICHHKY